MAQTDVKKPRYGTPESVRVNHLSAFPANPGRVLKGKEFEKRKKELERRPDKIVKTKPNEF